MLRVADVAKSVQKPKNKAFRDAQHVLPVGIAALPCAQRWLGERVIRCVTDRSQCQSALMSSLLTTSLPIEPHCIRCVCTASVRHCTPVMLALLLVLFARYRRVCSQSRRPSFAGHPRQTTPPRRVYRTSRVPLDDF